MCARVCAAYHLVRLPSRRTTPGVTLKGTEEITSLPSLAVLLSWASWSGEAINKWNRKTEIVGSLIFHYRWSAPIPGSFGGEKLRKLRTVLTPINLDGDWSIRSLINWGKKSLKDNGFAGEFISSWKSWGKKLKLFVCDRIMTVCAQHERLLTFPYETSGNITHVYPITFNSRKLTDKTLQRASFVKSIFIFLPGLSPNTYWTTLTICGSL